MVSEGVKIDFLNGNLFLAQIRSDYGKIIISKKCKVVDEVNYVTSSIFRIYDFSIIRSFLG